MTADEIYLLILFMIILILIGLLIWFWRIYTKTSRPGSVGNACSQCRSYDPSIVEIAKIFSSDGFEIESNKIQYGHYTHTLPPPAPSNTVIELWLKGSFVHLKVDCLRSF